MASAADLKKLKDDCRKQTDHHNNTGQLWPVGTTLVGMGGAYWRHPTFYRVESYTKSKKSMRLARLKKESKHDNGDGLSSSTVHMLADGPVYATGILGGKIMSQGRWSASKGGWYVVGGDNGLSQFPEVLELYHGQPITEHFYH